jgi:ferredoxin
MEKRMKTTLYWFSGTGNSLKTARMLAEKLGDCELKPVMRELKGEGIILTGDRVGICFPLYFLSFPKPVMDFLERMENPLGVPLFAVVTRGLAPMGGVLSPLKKLCRKACTELTGLFYLTLPNNDITLFKPDSERDRKAKMDKLPHEIDRVARSLATGQKRYDFEPLGWVRPFRHKPAYLNHLKDFGSHFTADVKCTGCGICVRVCPAGNIQLANGKPAWGDACVLCEGCLNWCPERAVQYDLVTANKGRYTCEGISVRDIALQNQGISK